MMTHRRARLLLYDHVRGVLPAREEGAVARHIARCPACAAEAASHRELLNAVTGHPRRPSDALPDSYWTGFANEVMGKIDAEPASRPGPIRRLTGLPGFGWSAGAPSPPDRVAGRALAGLAAAAAVTAVIWLFLPGTGEAPREESEETGYTAKESAGSAPVESSPTGAGADSLAEFDRRMSGYFRKSKTLLVGVSNSGEGMEGGFDLDSERRLSRSLLREARYLRSGPVDPGSYRLMDDLDRILIGLANSDRGASGQEIELIRGGIQRDNLLFKLRMQETRESRPPVRQAAYHGKD